MRVGVNTLFLVPGDVGGSQTYLVETLQGLLATFPDVALVLFTNLENDVYLREHLAMHRSVAFDCLRFRASNRTARIVREQVDLPRRIRRHALDGLWSPGYTAPVVCSVPQVVSVLDMQYKRFPQDLTPLARMATHALVCRAARGARRILTLSEFSKSEIIRFTAAPSERIDVTPLAANPVFSAPVDCAVSAAVCRRVAPDAVPFLLCVAHTYPHKNVAALVEAFALLRGVLPHRLVLVGKPRLGEPALRRALSRLPDASRVVRLESVNRTDLVALYQTCAAFVFPSLYEGFGLPILEAMAAGVPVVTADIPPAHEIGDRWLWTCDARDAHALARTIRDAVTEPPAHRDQRIAGARQRAATFSWEHTARQTRACFDMAFQ